MRRNSSPKDRCCRWLVQQCLALLAFPLLSTSAGVCAIVLAAIVSPAAAENDVLAERRAQIDDLDAADKEQLLREYERFQRLVPQEQDRLRSLAAQLDKDPDGAKLKDVMHRYHAWLSTLTAVDRAELANLPAKERVERVQWHLAKQDREHRDRLSSADSKVIWTWVEKMRAKREQQRDNPRDPPPDPEKRGPPRDAEKRGGREGFGGPGWGGPGRRGFDLRPSEAELKELHDALSEPARKRLDEADKPGQRRDLLWKWTWQAFRENFESRPVGKEELSRFYKELNDDERERLRSMSPTERDDNLKRMFLFQQRLRREGRDGFDRPPGRPPRDGDEPLPPMPRSNDKPD